MWIYLPEVKQKQGEARQYRFQGGVKENFDERAADESTFDLKLFVRGGDKEIHLSGRFEAEIEEHCSRCLRSFRQRLGADISDSFRVTALRDKKKTPAELALETANQLTVSGDYLYLDEYIRQIYYLGQIYSPLCKPDCRGLCAGCGVDLNETACLCEKEAPIDHRWQKLKEFRPDQ